jgi:hypothetical protein
MAVYVVYAQAFRDTVVELALLTGMALSLVVCLYLLRAKAIRAPATAERH